MVSIAEFCNRLMEGFEFYFRQRDSMRLITQSRESCRAILKACIEIEPDYVLDIGTNYGLPCLSLAYGLITLGKNLSVLTTSDIDLKHWLEETPIVQQELLADCRMDVHRIHAVQEDFNRIDPNSFVQRGKVLVFYDIHDTTTPPISYMRTFLDTWMPLFDHGQMMIHDFFLPGIQHWMDPDDPMYAITKARHISGLEFEGYPECKVLVDWLNQSERKLYPVPSTSVLKFVI